MRSLSAKETGQSHCVCASLGYLAIEISFKQLANGEIAIATLRLARLRVSGSVTELAKCFPATIASMI